jgi:hypothetical protein
LACPSLQNCRSNNDCRSTSDQTISCNRGSFGGLGQKCVPSARVRAHQRPRH